MRERGLLAIDVGSVTQDILYYVEGEDPASCFKMVLPSETQIVAGRIKQATSEKKPLFLRGNVMGGGACVAALKKHLSSGLDVCATPKAAATVHDDLYRVTALGIRLADEGPEGAVVIDLADVRPAKLRAILELAGLHMPEALAVAVLDHGFSPKESNRRFRFKLWERFVEKEATLKEMAFDKAPAELTRMRAVQEDAPGSYVMDTAAAAFLGALQDPVVRKESERGVAVINLGNQHTTAALIRGERLLGVMEHHTSMLTPGKLEALTARFRKGNLTGEEVFEDGGHGCVLSDGSEGLRFELVSITGPRRGMGLECGFHAASPYGDMMLVGCFGLIAGVGWL
jgi:uncharacterized protein (DUF1786 family)